MKSNCFSILTAVVLLLANATFTLAAGQVQLDLVGEARDTALSFQSWGQALSNAGIKNVRIRSARDTDRVGIEVQGTADRPLYIVTGKVISNNEIELPGIRFKRSELKRLAGWLDDLAQNGPPDKRPKTVAFGLTEMQLERVKKDLAVPVGFSTPGLSCREAVERIAQKLKSPIKLDADFVNNSADKKVEDELKGLSSGAALACLLRSAGYGFIPQASGQQITYATIKAGADSKDVWPVGHPSEKPLPEILPELYEYRNVNVQNIPAAKVLDAIGNRLKIPVLYDRAALDKYNIDPVKTMINYPNARTNYSLALRKMLFSVGLKFEIREDDAGTPFLWISTLKPM
jgi:hypothetical protein